jgi:hypothetical protein
MIPVACKNGEQAIKPLQTFLINTVAKQRLLSNKLCSFKLCRAVIISALFMIFKDSAAM